MPIDPDFLQPGGALASPVLQRALGCIADIPQELVAGTRIGAYRVVRELGRGGMAVVYLAERADGEFEQTVALKLVRPDHDSALAQELLRQERQVLANLQHPRIARLLDGGRSDDGTLWFALELVHGVRIDRYCRERELPLAARLQLFMQVCEAVQFAHSHLLIHRDIKPANILVTHDDAVKLLDFSIAQLITPDAQAPLAERALTPGYASPEQLRGEAVTTASDIYQLGGLLQSILMPEATAISGTDTMTASTRLLPAEHDAAAIAPVSGMPRDIAAVIVRATQAQPAARYATAAELKVDVENFIALRPVLARHGGRAYRLRCYVRRHRWSVLAAALALAAFAATIMHFTLRVRAERDQAHLQAQHAAAEARRANQVTEFLLGMFKVADPDVNRGDRLTATQILERGAQQAQTTLTTQPDLLANLFAVIGEVYTNLGDYPRADPLLQRAADLRDGDASTSAQDRAHSLRQLAYVKHKRSEFAAALDLLERAQSVLRTDASPAANSELAAILDQRALAQKHLGDLQGALASHTRALELAQGAGDDERIAAVQGHLGLLLYVLDRQVDAQRAYETALAINLRLHGERHEATLAVRENLATDLAAQGQYDLAVAQMRAAIETETQLLGSDNPERAQTLNMLGNIYLDAERLQDAADAFTQALDITRRTLGADSDQAASISSNLGAVYGDLKQYQRAHDYLQQAVAVRRKLNGPDHYETAQTELMLASTTLKLGHIEEAERLARLAAEKIRKGLPPEHSYQGTAQITLGEILLAKHDYAGARSLLEGALSNAQQQHDEPGIHAAQELLAQLPTSAQH